MALAFASVLMIYNVGMFVESRKKKLKLETLGHGAASTLLLGLICMEIVKII